jgi:hypothetical protein
VIAVGRNAGGQNSIPAAATGTGYVGIAAGNYNNVLLAGIVVAPGV